MSVGSARHRPSPLRRLLPVALAALVAFLVLIGLGTWQLERLAWKQDLIAKVEARIHQPPQPAPDEANWSQVTFEADEYRPVQVQGRFRHDLEVQVYTLIDRTPEGGGGPGYWVITPLELPDGATILVNRGFVPPDRRDPASRAEGLVPGAFTVTGLLRLPEEAGLFTPGNDPARDSWFVRDPVAIGGAKGVLRVAPFFIDADSTPVPGGVPQGGLTRISFPNRHLEYALTWYGLAASLLGVFLVYAWGRLRRA